MSERFKFSVFVYTSRLCRINQNNFRPFYEAIVMNKLIQQDTPVAERSGTSTTGVSGAALSVGGWEPYADIRGMVRCATDGVQQMTTPAKSGDDERGDRE